MKKYIFVFFVSVILFSCKDKCIKGDQNVMENGSRYFSEGFDYIQSDINYPVTIVQVYDSLDDEVMVTTDGNLDPYVLAWVDSKNATLHIELDPDHCVKPSSPMSIFVYAHQVHGVISNSSGDIYCDDVSTDNLNVRINNNGYIRMRGIKITNHLTAEVGGSGLIDIQGSGRSATYINNGNSSQSKITANYMMLSGDCSANCTGPGTISLYCDSRLTADAGLNGGFIYFYGEPIVYGPLERVIPGP